METAAAKYLKEVYGLEPEDVNLEVTDTIEDVEWIAQKYDLTKKEDMTIKKATRVLRRFEPPSK